MRRPDFSRFDEIVASGSAIFNVQAIRDHAAAAGAVAFVWDEEDGAWVFRTLNGTVVASVFEDGRYWNAAALVGEDYVELK